MDSYGAKILQAILDDNHTLSEQVLGKAFQVILERKLLEVKKMIQAESILQEEVTQLDEWPKAKPSRNIQHVGRYKVIKVRLRKGKVQRRKRLSDVKGYTTRNGKLVRMSNKEKLNRKLGQRRGKLKRKAQRSRINQRFHRSLERRRAMGL